jgi:hypothetical protein
VTAGIPSSSFESFTKKLSHFLPGSFYPKKMLAAAASPCPSASGRSFIFNVFLLHIQTGEGRSERA